jgi:hypothetical protein
VDGTENQKDDVMDSSGIDSQDDSTASSADKKESSPRTYTEEEYNTGLNEARTKAFSDFMAKSGVKYKPIEDENKTLKVQINEHKSMITDAQETIEKLSSQIDELSSDDPDKKKLVKRLREVEDFERRLKSEKLALENDRAEFNKTRSLQTASRLAKEFNVDEKVLLDLTDGTPEKMEMLAKILPKVKKEEEKKAEKKPGVVADSGDTKGNNPDFNKMTPEEKIDYGLKHPKK